MDFKQSFWRHVVKTETCWLWTGAVARARGGYGHYNDGIKVWRSHKYAYVCTHGAVPAGLCLLHTCDNPICVNPAHLEVGTRAKNMKDASLRGRLAHKLSNDKVRALRAFDFINVITHKELAAIFNVSRAAISYVIRGQNRSHV